MFKNLKRPSGKKGGISIMSIAIGYLIGVFFPDLAYMVGLKKRPKFNDQTGEVIPQTKK